MELESPRGILDIEARHQVVAGVDRTQPRPLSTGRDVNRLGLGQDDLPPGTVHVARDNARHAELDRLADIERRDLLFPAQIQPAVAHELGLAFDPPRNVPFSQSLGVGHDGTAQILRLEMDPVRQCRGDVDAQRLHAAVEHVVDERAFYLYHARFDAADEHLPRGNVRRAAFRGNRQGHGPARMGERKHGTLTAAPHGRQPLLGFGKCDGTQSARLARIHAQTLGRVHDHASQLALHVGRNRPRHRHGNLDFLPRRRQQARGIQLAPQGQMHAHLADRLA